MNVVGVNRHVPREGAGVMGLPRAVRDLGAGAVREGLAAAALIYVPPLHPIVRTSPLAGDPRHFPVCGLGRRRTKALAPRR